MMPPTSVETKDGQRAWIERGFKVFKREGWQWHRTRMMDPRRVARLWLVLAVGTVRLISAGTEADEGAGHGKYEGLMHPALQCEQGIPSSQGPSVSLFKRGWILILVALILQKELPTGYFVPEVKATSCEPPEYFGQQCGLGLTANMHQETYP